MPRLIAAVPYKIHTVLTDNGIQFTIPPTATAIGADGAVRHAHASTCVCRENGIEHRLTKPKHPWTNGQVERMNRTIKDATVKRYPLRKPRSAPRGTSPTSSQPTTSAERLKTLKGLTPYEFICKRWTTEPERFNLNPLHQMPGLNT